MGLQMLVSVPTCMFWMYVSIILVSFYACYIYINTGTCIAYYNICDNMCVYILYYIHIMYIVTCICEDMF